MLERKEIMINELDANIIIHVVLEEKSHTQYRACLDAL